MAPKKDKRNIRRRTKAKDQQISYIDKLRQSDLAASIELRVAERAPMKNIKDEENE